MVTTKIGTADGMTFEFQNILRREGGVWKIAGWGGQ
jgi:hypothetical protein